MVASSSVERLLGASLGGGPVLDRGPVTGQVVKVAADGAWVAVLGSAVDTPAGPCRGPSVVVGDVVLLIDTPQGPWIAAVDA